jgi:chromosome segregation ATPase
MDITDIPLFFENVGMKVNAIVTSLQTNVDTLQKELNILKTVNKGLSEDLQTALFRVVELEKDNRNLINKIDGLEEDRKNFSRVSQIIAMEKENSRLKTEIDTLNSKLQRMMDATKKQKTILPETKEEECNDEVPQPDLSQPNLLQPTILQADSELASQTEQSLKIKKIKGRNYYVSEDNIIYEYMDDASAGKALGCIDKINNKLKASWY